MQAAENIRYHRQSLIESLVHLQMEFDEYFTNLEAELETMEAEHDIEILHDEDDATGKKYCDLYQRKEAVCEFLDNLRDFIAEF